jgi:hypothetical protein
MIPPRQFGRRLIVSKGEFESWRGREVRLTWPEQVLRISVGEERNSLCS